MNQIYQKWYKCIEIQDHVEGGNSLSVTSQGCCEEKIQPIPICTPLHAWLDCRT